MSANPSLSTDGSPERYNSVAIILHWLMAIGFLLMIICGLIMQYADISKSLQFQMYQWHKSGGVLLFLVAFLRLLVRLLGSPPSLPTDFAGWEIRAARLGHWSLYVLMFALPLSGWVMVSSSIFGIPTIVFGWFQWPHLPGIKANAPIEEAAKWVHFILAMAFILAIAIHIAAVVKHHMIDRHNLVKRLWWSP